MTRYVYFVCFQHLRGPNEGWFVPLEPRQVALGNMELILNSPIGSIEDIRAIENLLEKESPGFAPVVIVNYQLLREEKVDADVPTL